MVLEIGARSKPQCFDTLSPFASLKVPIRHKPLCFRLFPALSTSFHIPDNIAAETHRERRLVGWQGLEPWTNALKGHCSTD